MAESISSAAKSAKEEELADLIQRFMASLAELSEHLPFTVDRQVPNSSALFTWAKSACFDLCFFIGSTALFVLYDLASGCCWYKVELVIV